MTPAVFIPGRELSRLYFVEAVKPILDDAFPDLRYDATLIGGLDQWSDSTDLREQANLRLALRAIYGD